jgi:phosphohistidine phosphatase SixA
MMKSIAVLLMALSLTGASLPAGSNRLRQGYGASAIASATAEDPAATKGPTDPSATKDPTDPAATINQSVAQGSSELGGASFVFLVRHAERADAGMAAAKMAGADPELSDAGKARAQALAAMLKDAKIAAIFTTQYKRTKDTAQPLAAATGVQAVAIDSNDAALLVAKVKAASGNIVVVGHSNTVPDVIKSLGISEPIAIADDQFDNLFVVVRGAQPTLLRLHYR